VSNQLFNGQLVASQSGGIAIVDQSACGNWSNLIQTGPLLYLNGVNRSVPLKNDEPKRRIIAATSADHDPIIMIVVTPDSLYSGPYLRDLPAVISAIASKEGFTIQDAINLDGGSASVFKNETNYFRELKTVGTFLCFP
jgi:hypothetical protein